MQRIYFKRARTSPPSQPPIIQDTRPLCKKKLPRLFNNLCERQTLSSFTETAENGIMREIAGTAPSGCPFRKEETAMLKDKTVLLGVTGGIAAYKAAALASALVKQHAHVEVIMSANATEFITPLTF